MFVRWKNRELRSEVVRGVVVYPVAHTAVLVESRRVDGKPRQKILTTIATYRSGYEKCGDPEWFESSFRHRRTKFWNYAKQNLDWLGDKITPEQRAQVESALAERVPKLTEADIAANEAKRQELMRGMARAGVSPPQWMMPSGSA